MRESKDIQLRRWWIGELTALTEKVMKAEEKRQASIRKRAEKLMGEYEGWTYTDLQEAYGCGSITERQFDRLADLLEQKDPVPDELYSMKLDLLSELYQEQKKILDTDERFEKIQKGSEQDA